nr:MAG TPA: hypothetical protein [Bacteriophage sp.]
MATGNRRQANWTTLMTAKLRSGKPCRQLRHAQ